MQCVEWLHNRSHCFGVWAQRQGRPVCRHVWTSWKEAPAPLSSAGAQVCKQEEQRCRESPQEHQCLKPGQRPKICFENSRHEVIFSEVVSKWIQLVLKVLLYSKRGIPGVTISCSKWKCKCGCNQCNDYFHYQLVNIKW